MAVPRLSRPKNAFPRSFKRSRVQGLFLLAMTATAILFVHNLNNLVGLQHDPRQGSLLLDTTSRVMSVVSSPDASSSSLEVAPPPPTTTTTTTTTQAPEKAASNPVDAELNGEEEPVHRDDLDGADREDGEDGGEDDDSANDGDDGSNEEDGADAAKESTRADEVSIRDSYALFGAEVGILSDTPFEDYVGKHKEIDDFDNTQRCRRYGYSYSKTGERNRRIFYGAVIQDEPWELFEILSAESYGLLEAMVFVELDRDYYGQPRTPLRLDAGDLLKRMFGVDKVRVIKYSNDDPGIKGEMLYDLARNEVVAVWKDLGMTVDDVGYMSSIDDMFARDYLNAIRHCELPEMKYDLHHCLYNRVKVFGNNQVYETSPECVSRTKRYEHPDAMIGACIQGIGDETANILAPRDESGVYRAKGWNCEDRETEKDIKDGKFPLWSGSDIRSLCGGRQANVRAAKHQQYSAFHFRNWFNTARDMRLKVTTEDELYDKSMDDLGEDPMRVTYRCIKDIPDEQNAVWKREPGGYSVLKPMTPLYLANDSYRAAVHQRATKKILDDEKNVKPQSPKMEKKEVVVATGDKMAEKRKPEPKKMEKKEVVVATDDKKAEKRKSEPKKEQKDQAKMKDIKKGGKNDNQKKEEDVKRDVQKDEKNDKSDKPKNEKLKKETGKTAKK